MSRVARRMEKLYHLLRDEALGAEGIQAEVGGRTGDFRFSLAENRMQSIILAIVIQWISNGLPFSRG
jgi:hypothetical protein